jgi:uncharacterized protein (TIGR02996 family)
MRDEQAGFIAAIRAAEEEDDLPTLIYADWLEEQGDGSRAGFIRAQVAAERSPEAGPAAGWLRSADPAEGADLRLPPGIGRGRYRRGLMRGLESRGIEPLLEHGPGLVERFPLSALRVRGAIGDEGLARILGEPWLIDVVELIAAGAEIGPAGARLLARAEALPRLRRLDLRYNALGDSGLMALADSPLRERIEALRLSDNKFGPAGARALAGRGPWGRLRSLSVSFNRLGEGGIAPLLDPGAFPALAVLEAHEVGGIDEARGRLDWGRSPASSS